MNVPPVAELRRVCQPPDLDVCIFRRFLTRRVSIHFTRFFLLCGVSANAVSALKGLIASAGSLLFITGEPLYWLAGAALLQVSFILDASDGEVARFTGTCSSARGEFIDKIGDAASRSLFYGAWGIGLYSRTGNALYTASGMAMAGLWPIVRFCLMETILESMVNHRDTPPSLEEREAAGRLFARAPGEGGMEYFLSMVYHPWLNLALAAALLSFLGNGPSGLFFLVYSFLWAANTVRKTAAALRTAGFRRPEA